MMNTKRLLSVFFMFILLIGCAPIIPQTSEPIRSTGLSVTPSPLPSYTGTYTQTFTPTSFPPGFTPSPAPAFGYPEGSCQLGPVEELEFNLPVPSELKWEHVESFQRLKGLTGPIHFAYPSPDDRWWVIELVTQRESSQYELATEEALYVLDSLENRHWMLSEKGRDDFHRFDWFPNNELIWVDNGQLYRAHADGQGKQTLQVPEPIIEVWLDKITGSRALVGGQSALWRLDLNTNLWEKVKGLESLVRNGQPPVSRVQANLRLSKDGRFGALLADHQIWKISMAFGELADKIGEVEYSDEAWRPEAPQPLVDSPYWYPGRDVYISDSSNPRYGTPALINEEDGSLLSLQDIVPPNFGHLLSLQISPDARWLAVRNGEFHGSEAIYLVSTSRLTPGKANGTLVQNVSSVLDWDITEVRSIYPERVTHLATAFVLTDDPSAGTSTLDQINLVTGETRRIKDLPYTNYIVIRRMTWVKDRPILAEGETLESISENGTVQIIGSVPEIEPYEYPRVLVGGTNDQLLFATAVDKTMDNLCRTFYSLYVARLDAAK